MPSVTAANLKALGPNGQTSYVNILARAAPDVLSQYSITTPLRMAHFWAQAAHECDGFRTMQEYASGDAYEGRRDLGNTVPGDGRRFKGRGIFQLTGRANYKDMGGKLGIDLLDNPNTAADPEVAIKIACRFWQDKGLNRLADKNDILGISKRINGINKKTGQPNGMPDRRARFNTAWKIWGNSDKEPAPTKTIVTSKTAGAAVTTAAASGGGIFASYQAGQAVVSQISDAKDTAASAAGVFGVSGPMALAIGFGVIALACVGFIIWDRYMKIKTEGI